MPALITRGQYGTNKSSKGVGPWKGGNSLKSLCGKSGFFGGEVVKTFADHKSVNKCQALKFRRRNNKATIQCQGEEFKLYPFDEKDYVKVQLKLYMEPQDIKDRYLQGNLIYTKDGEDLKQGVTALIMQVGGDTLQCLSTALQKANGDRPMSLDLLYTVLERGKEISSSHWGLVRVAVVDLQNNVFHGRLFFGDTRTGKVVWDCDCRPSDGSWLAIKYNVPIYVHNNVWKECARGLSFSTTPEKKVDGQPVEENYDPNDPFQVRANDFEVIKLLKREMQVALTEENYSEAARIRDHPYLKIYMRMIQSQQEGRLDNAKELQKQLQEMINESEKRRVED
eukprot:TRINITY_DN3267_c0_g1_i4.p2 TRINITY_DN3267_c0_g1~~TRINITY_DN3267_c0_g1_i4.p2  ORF type:complete len:390 (-),score=21.24 TRINITY_DN3267_c0_g1_i4:488-1501(-)